ncbi:MAG: hypothetical protein GY829_07420, partial [Gammaproteobacteria bacterium]|nr:hypothetical protein [Gammaproteobacteria bacterium]
MTGSDRNLESCGRNMASISVLIKGCHNLSTINSDHYYLQLDGLDEDPMQQLLSHSITYRVAVGAQQGKKVFTLKTMAGVSEDRGNSQAAKESGFS